MKGMRTIKFREWSVRYKKMRGITSFTCNWGVMGELITAEANPLMQYTGYNDCDGVEIFEGDIISVDDGYNCEVLFTDSEGCLTAAGTPLFREPFRHTLKVIGNVHDPVYKDLEYFPERTASL